MTSATLRFCQQRLRHLAADVVDRGWSAMPSQYPRCVYVIELDSAAFGKSVGTCFYVGETYQTPEERFRQHKAGFKAARVVKRFALKLRPDLYEMFPRVAHRSNLKSWSDRSGQFWRVVVSKSSDQNSPRRIRDGHLSLHGWRTPRARGGLVCRGTNGLQARAQSG